MFVSLISGSRFKPFSYTLNDEMLLGSKTRCFLLSGVTLLVQEITLDTPVLPFLFLFTSSSAFVEIQRTASGINNFCSIL